MLSSKKTVQIAGLTMIVVAISNWWLPSAAAEEVILPKQMTTRKNQGESVTLKLTLGTHFQDREPQRRREREDTKKLDWESELRRKIAENDKNIKLLDEQAIMLSLSMVVITYNSPPAPPQTVVSAASGTNWQWKAWCWANPSQPSLPPPQGGTINSVPEPSSLVSGLIGVGIAGISLWRRIRRPRNS